MKRYQKPEIEMTSFEVEDIITISGIFDLIASTTEVMIDGESVDATNYGSKPFSIFDVK